jgi:hypothetical protein
MKSVIMALALVAAGVMGIQAIPIDAQSGCSDPVPYEEDDRFLIQRCDEGSYMIDTEDGSKSWISSNELGDKSCSRTETGLPFCILRPD